MCFATSFHECVNSKRGYAFLLKGEYPYLFCVPWVDRLVLLIDCISCYAVT